MLAKMGSKQNYLFFQKHSIPYPKCILISNNSIKEGNIRKNVWKNFKILHSLNILN